MAGFRKGPFTIKWRGNTIENIEEVSTDVSQDTEERTTLGGLKLTFDGPILASATLKIMKSDIPTLAAVFPQFYVPNGGVLSTGETVSHAEGAIDIKALSCDDETVYGPLDIISCGTPAQVARLVNARTKIDTTEFNNYLGTVSVQFLGEPEEGEGNIQFFNQGSIAVVS
jgi:hypothetical protein